MLSATTQTPGPAASVRYRGRVDASAVEVTLFLVGIPLAVTAVIMLFAYVPDSIHASGRRYRPGKPWTFEPMWLESSQSAAGREQSEQPGAPALGHAGPPALPAGTAVEVERAAAERAPVPGPRVTHARAQRVAARSRGATVTVVHELPGGARGTW